MQRVFRDARVEVWGPVLLSLTARPGPGRTPPSAPALTAQLGTAGHFGSGEVGEGKAEVCAGFPRE